jgi:hypothetical protein
VAGLERDRALEVLHDPRAFRIWLAARSIVLASLVGVPCATIALVMGYQGQPVVKVAAACAVILVLPFGILPISACVGLLLPFHRRSFGWRWQHRHWRRVFRWVILLLAPFVVVPVVAGIIVGPSLLVARALGAPQIPLSSASFVLLAACIVVCALLAAWGGLRLASGLRSRRRDHLERYLLDPEAA